MSIDYIKTIIEKAFQLAVTKAIEIAAKEKITEPKKLHTLRAREWVEALADNFREHYKTEDNIRVFSKYNSSNQKDFGLNELLFDISVVKVNTIESPRHKELTYIEKALWLVESEMAKDTRQLVLDFSKLVMGDAENKLFIGPLSDEIIKFVPQLSAIARNCKGSVYLCLIPHPENWKNDEINLKTWYFDSKNFIEYD